MEGGGGGQLQNEQFSAGAESTQPVVSGDEKAEEIETAPGPSDQQEGSSGEPGEGDPRREASTTPLEEDTELPQDRVEMRTSNFYEIKGQIPKRFDHPGKYYCLASLELVSCATPSFKK